MEARCWIRASSGTAAGCRPPAASASGSAGCDTCFEMKAVYSFISLARNSLRATPRIGAGFRPCAFSACSTAGSASALKVARRRVIWCATSSTNWACSRDTQLNMVVRRAWTEGSLPKHPILHCPSSLSDLRCAASARLKGRSRDGCRLVLAMTREEFRGLVFRAASTHDGHVHSFVRGPPMAAVERIVVQTTPQDKEALVSKAKALNLPRSESMRRAAFAYPRSESDMELGSLTDAAKTASDNAAKDIDEAGLCTAAGACSGLDLLQRVPAARTRMNHGYINTISSCQIPCRARCPARVRLADELAQAGSCCLPQASSRSLKASGTMVWRWLRLILLMRSSCLRSSLTRCWLKGGRSLLIRY